jgi:hypothetical protein
MHNSAIRRCSRGTHQHYPQSSEAAKDVVAHSAIKPISGNFLKLDGVGQVIPNKLFSRKVWI